MREHKKCVKSTTKWRRLPRMRMLWGVVFVCLASLAEAQPLKPVCAYSPAGAPSWVTCGSLASFASNAEVIEARDRCRTTGFRWIVQAGFDVSPLEPMAPYGAALRARYDALGFTPCVVGVTYGEEWYERWEANHFAAYGFPSTLPESVAIPVIEAWTGQQMAALEAALGVPSLWVTALAGAIRPVPNAADFIALEAYVPAGQTWATSADAVLRYAVETTAKPIVIVPQWFQAVGPQQPDVLRAGPTAEAIAGTAAWLAHPRVVALWGFLWQSRPHADLVGLADLPEAASAVARSLGVR